MFLLVYAISCFFSSPLPTPTKDNDFDHRRLSLENEGLFGGDMMINLDDETLRNGVLDERYLWPGYPGSARIPYVIDDALLSYRPLILKAMKQYQDHTCVRFVERTNEREYVKFIYGNGCYSYVGRDLHTTQPQELSLGYGCHYIGTIVHQLGHAVGLFHEQNRSDRDSYIDMHLENVDQKKWNNFKKLNASEILLFDKFDYNSIMIYGNKAFSNNGNFTMIAKNGQPLTEPYQKGGLNRSDVERVNKLYKCR